MDRISFLPGLGCAVAMLLLSLASPRALPAQEQRMSSDFQVSLRAMVHLSGREGNHLTLGLSVGTALRRKNVPVALLLQSAVNVYGKGLGTNILDSYRRPAGDGEYTERRRRLEVDLVQSVIGNLEFGPLLDGAHRYLFPIKHFNQMTAYSNHAYTHYTLSYGTNFLFNSGHRNQQIGFAGVNTPWVSLGFYNDGTMGGLVGDDYDRYWTGGGHIRLHLYNPSNPGAAANEFSLEYNFDRFTHDVQDGYRLANILLIPNADDVSFYNLLYNNSLITFKANWRQYSLGYSLLGRSNMDIQDFIHRTLGYPRHLTYARPEHMVTFGYLPMIR